ncbi:hypothetical protein [Xanthomonas axonopodis]
MNEAGEGVRVHLVGGPQDGQMLCGATLPGLALPQGYRMTPWPGGQTGIHWHREFNLASAHESLAAEQLSDALNARWRHYLATRRQQAAASRGGDVNSGCADAALA